MIVGARQGSFSVFKRLVSFAISQDLGVYVIPGTDISRAHGLDIEAAGMTVVASPRHASVLLIVGDINPALSDSAAVIYAQMPRPRVLFNMTATENSELSPLPSADITTELSQQALINGVARLRKIVREGAFHTEIFDFDAPVLQIRIEYVCPMHPEVIRDEPGSCPKCGMDLLPREVQANVVHNHTEHKTDDDVHVSMQHAEHQNTVLEYTCPMHPEVVQNEPGSCPKCGMDLEPREVETQHNENVVLEYTCPMHPEVIQSEPGSCHKCGMDLEPREVETQHNENVVLEYTCPMHPEVIQSEPGSCPKCGMDLEPREVEAKQEHHSTIEYTCPMHPEVIQDEPGSCPQCGMFLEPRKKHASTHDHDAMDLSVELDPNFMSMIDVTKDLPRSVDGLQMDWIDVPFGPFFPGLPSGLSLSFTLDGDTIAASTASSLTGNKLSLCHAINSDDFIQRLSSLEPITPMSYKILACLAIEDVANIKIDVNTERARVFILERERIISHLSWLTLFAEQTGFGWLQDKAWSLQSSFMQADVKQIKRLKKSVVALNKRLQSTPLLKSCTKGIGSLLSDAEQSLFGPNARASGLSNDARSGNKLYSELGFTSVTKNEGDTYARLQIRLTEIKQSIELIERLVLSSTLSIDNFNTSPEYNIEKIMGHGQAVIETPRGQARLQITIDNGLIASAQLETPSTHHLELIEQLTAQQELGAALLAVGSLDLSPWEIQ